MSYKYTKRKIPYSKMSVQKLEEIANDIKAKNPNLESEIDKYYNHVEEIKKQVKRKDELNLRESEIRQIGRKRAEEKYNSKGLLAKIFSDKNEPVYTEQEKKELNKINNIFSSGSLRYNYNPFEYAFNEHERLERIYKHIETKKKKERQKNRDKGLIASYNKKSRERATTIKNQLRNQLNKTNYCPYCGNLLGENLHCDHIYPVARGGLSTPENMVYICVDCNVKKRDMTLSQYVKKHGLERKLIEKRLDELEKAY